MSLFDVLTQIRDTLKSLHPNAFESQLLEWQRGGFPTKSMSDGSPDAELHLPVNEGQDENRELGRPAIPGGGPRDRFDGNVRAALDAYDDALGEILDVLVELAALELKWLPPDEKREPTRYRLWREDMERLARETVSPRAQSCANPNCKRVVERTGVDPLRMGRCTNCAAYKKRTGKERPRELVDEEMGRRAG